MIWFVKQRLPLSHSASIVAATALTLLLGDLPFPVPDIGLGPAPRITMSMFLPAVVACAVGAATTGGTEREAIARRPLGLIDAGWSIAMAAAVSLPHVTVLVIAGSTSAGDSLRNTVGFLGMGLIARRTLRGIVVTAAPALLAMAMAVLSSSTDHPLVAWPYRPHDDGNALLLALALWLTGLLVGTGRRVLGTQPLME